MGFMTGKSVQPVYLQFLAAALAAYIAATSFWLGNLITRVGEIEHKMEHGPRNKHK